MSAHDDNAGGTGKGPDDLARPQDQKSVMARMVARLMAERTRQIDVEGHTPAHDDCYTDGSLARAASTYALAASMSDWQRGGHRRGVSKLLREYSEGYFTRIRTMWPWDWGFWKPQNRLRELEKAGALILAEMERLERLNMAAAAELHAPKKPDEADKEVETLARALFIRYDDMMMQSGLHTAGYWNSAPATTRNEWCALALTALQHVGRRSAAAPGEDESPDDWVRNAVAPAMAPVIERLRVFNEAASADTMRINLEQLTEGLRKHMAEIDKALTDHHPVPTFDKYAAMKYATADEYAAGKFLYGGDAPDDVPDDVPAPSTCTMQHFLGRVGPGFKAAFTQDRYIAGGPLDCWLCGDPIDAAHAYCGTASGIWHPECFACTPCGRGEHDQGCALHISMPTPVMTDDEGGSHG